MESCQKRKSGVLIHPCMRGYRVGLFSSINEFHVLDVIESGRPSSGAFVSKDRAKAVNRSSNTFVPRSGFKIPWLRNSNFSIFKALGRKYEFIVFSSFISLPFLMLAGPARLLGKKVFVFDELWCYPTTIGYRLRAFFYKALVRLCVDGFILAGTNAYEFNNAFFKNNVRRVIAFNTHSRNLPSLPARPRSEKLLYLGRVVEIKGLDILLQALPLTDKELVVYGAGTHLANCKKICKELGIEDRVEFHGECEQAEVDSILQSYKYFILPGRRMFGIPQQVESWGFTVNEALANGCITICSDSVGAARDLINDGKNGFVFPQSDHLALAEKINMLSNITSSPEQIQQMLAERCDDYENAVNITHMMDEVFFESCNS